jgi:hypothetical protein
MRLTILGFAMNSTGQNLGVNPLMGATDTAVTAEAAKPVSSASSDDKSLKNKGFSDYMEGQQESDKPLASSSAEEQPKPAEAANAGAVLNTAPPAPTT